MNVAFVLHIIATLLIYVAVFSGSFQLRDHTQRIEALELQDHSCQCVTVESYPDDSIFYEDPICK